MIGLKKFDYLQVWVQITCRSILVMLYSLILCKVSIAFNKNIEEHLHELNLDDKRPLAIMDKLSGHFSNSTSLCRLRLLVSTIIQ